MEEAEVREVSGANESGWSRAALGLAGLALAAIVVWALTSAPARAQVPPIYDIPTPTPTPTATPFQDPPQPQPPARPSRLNPFPTVRTAGSFSGARTSFTRVTVRAPKGARIVARCSKRRCRTVRRTATSGRTRRLKALQRSYPPRTTIEIRVSSPTAIGKYVRIRTLRGRRPARRDRCLAPGSPKPVSCEGS